jgi:N-acetyl-anhydromuramyl-L-alanine amidase AmpD
MLEPLKLSELVQVDFSPTQYYREETTKTQVVLHHTVSGAFAQGVVDWWNTDPQRIATSFVIQGDGKIYQLFSTKYWAHHLGVKASFLKKIGFNDYGIRNNILNKGSVGIEICNWGALLKGPDNHMHPIKWDTKLKKFVPNLKITIDDNRVEAYNTPFRDFNYFEKYTKQQIDSTERLLIYLCNKFNISKNYNSNMWDVSRDALSGKSGIWTHVSMRSDKSDLHPMPEMIEMLQNL